MPKKKGLFKSENTKLHNKIVHSLKDIYYLSSYLSPLVVLPNYDIEIEKPVYSKTGFLFGFADAVIDCVTLFSGGSAEANDVIFEGAKFKPQVETWMIEVKTYIPDINDLIRQVKIYRDNLQGIDKTFVIYLDHKTDIDIDGILANENIYPCRIYTDYNDDYEGLRYQYHNYMKYLAAAFDAFTKTAVPSMITRNIKEIPWQE